MNSPNAANPTSLWDTPRKYAPYIFSVWLLSRISFFVFAHLSNIDVLRALCQWDCHWFSHTALNHYDLQPWATSDGDAVLWDCVELPEVDPDGSAGWAGSTKPDAPASQTRASDIIGERAPERGVLERADGQTRTTASLPNAKLP